MSVYGRVRAVNVRTRTVSTRVTKAEYIALQEQAWSTGKTVCDWARECIARQLEKGSRKSLEAHLFTELVGIQLLLMDALGPLLRVNEWLLLNLLRLFREVQARKAGKAQELLNKRRSRELETRGNTQTSSAGAAIS